MSSGLVPVRRALVSVADKTGLVELANGLHSMGVEVFATGGSLAELRESAVPAKSLQDDMGLPTALSGRVKTLHAPLHASILARGTREHLEELSAMGVTQTDLVVCNFYKFEEALKGGLPEQELVEKIDIGGPTMVRAASKNFERVLVVTSPSRYNDVIEEMRRNEGKTSLDFRRKLAVEAFAMTASYDALIFRGLKGTVEGLPNKLIVTGTKAMDMKYGENPGVKGVIYSLDGYRNLTEWKQLAGDTLSFNNYLDIGSAYEMVIGYDEFAAAATVKHGHISGFAFASSVGDAYSLAHACDPEADFGGTVVTNKEVDEEAAKLIGRNEGAKDSSVYTEILMAPGFTEGAVKILRGKQKKKIRLIQAGGGSDFPLNLKVIEGAVLAQSKEDYRKRLDPSIATVPTKAKPDQATYAKLLATWEVVRRVHSNGIVIADGSVDSGRMTKFWTLGVASFRKRNGAVRIALENAGKRAKGAVCASDGFFPFRDSVDLLGEAGVKAVIQPGGSTNDESIVQAADEKGIPMVFTHTRAFRH